MQGRYVSYLDHRRWGGHSGVIKDPFHLFFECFETIRAGNTKENSQLITMGLNRYKDEWIAMRTGEGEKVINTTS